MSQKKFQSQKNVVTKKYVTTKFKSQKMLSNKKKIVTNFFQSQKNFSHTKI